MNAPVKQNMPALAGGGHVMAIVPQTFEETFRVAKAVYLGGLAPSALVGKLEGDAAISAVTVAIMSGAELGLKPMVALRSFTVINGKPALYGDGLINVVRQSGKVAYLRTGCEVRDGQMIGWCEAKRNDTDEDKRVEFSQEDAIRAGLWQTEAVVTKWNKWDKKNEQKPNDSPWWRFPQRMLAWRAAGYCLRELFGDVLGGIRDEFEAREIADAEDMRDITPNDRRSPPMPPSPPEPPVEDAEVTDVTEEETVDSHPESPIDPTEFFQELEEQMAGAMDEATVEEVWSSLDPDGNFDGDDINLDIAHKIKQRRLAQINGG
ncbi:hypothetical protein RMR10_004430 [Agrobacterium rosae]|uniref:hypothetical protein n=1 Tax=Agrobacterium rosae TaxID=1972867 RepID=UPI002A0D3F98|nr:hypothetical protein [Agrobacterium rosae]MDX8315632.1 hypothetical protein [Agrobacterium rosae]